MIVAFSVTPLGVGEEVSGEVARAVQVVRSSGLPNHTDARTRPRSSGRSLSKVWNQ